jgi:hypothetical protein
MVQNMLLFCGGGREVYLRSYVGEFHIFHNISDGPIKWFFLGEKRKKRKQTNK